jgi:hypothetical protein
MNMPKQRKLSPAKRQASLDPLTILGHQFSLASLGLWMYAEEYIGIATAAPSTKLNMAQFALICHAIELLLKASLSVDGEALLALSEGPYGHDLDALMTAAMSKPTCLRSPLSPEHQAEIRRAAKYHTEKVFLYPAPAEALQAYPSKPDMATLTEAAQVLLEHLEVPCKNAG